MRKKNKKWIATLLAGTMCVTLLSACASNEPSASSKETNNEQTQEKEQPVTEDSKQTVTEETEQPFDTSLQEKGVSSVGEFTTQDVNGNEYTQDMFKEHDLTMVNIFTTWCTPCVEEMPDLEKLYQQMEEQGVGVVGVVLDVLNEKGEIVQDDLERAQLLVERTGVTYPVILPDSTYMNGRLIGIEGFPETFFVDKEGNIVGETYSGNGDLEYWLSVVEKEMAALEESN